jgi:hypothetical protein
VAVVELNMFYDPEDYETRGTTDNDPLIPPAPKYMMVVSNLIHPRRFEETYLPVMMIWDIGVSPSTNIYSDCVPRIFSSLEFETPLIDKTEHLSSGSIYITLHFRKKNKW